MSTDFLTVTELAGERVSQEQIDRLCHRYYWAGDYCDGRDVLEVACGSGQGLGYLLSRAKSLEAGDVSERILEQPRAHYGKRVTLHQFDAQALPFEDASKDVVILFEAIYYVPDATKFVAECARVLRPGGCVLLATANKDLEDFNPSPYSHVYYGVRDLQNLFAEGGFDTEFFGYLSVREVSWRQRLLRPIKTAVVSLGLMPKTMKGKRLLKRLVFGELVSMPNEIVADMFPYRDAVRVAASEPDTEHKVIYCRATFRN